MRPPTGRAEIAIEPGSQLCSLRIEESMAAYGSGLKVKGNPALAISDGPLGRGVAFQNLSLFPGEPAPRFLSCVRMCVLRPLS